MKNFFKLVSISALAAAVYGVPVANANIATPEACVANDLTLVYDLSELNFDADGVSTRLKTAFQNGVFTSQAVSVGAPFDLPDAGVAGLFAYEVDSVVYTDSDPFVIPATSEDTVTVKVRFATKGTLAKGVVLRNDAVSVMNPFMLFYIADGNGGYGTPTAYVNLSPDPRYIGTLSPAKGGTLLQFLDSMNISGNSAVTAFFTRDGYTLRGFEYDTAAGYYPTVSVNSPALSQYGLYERNQFALNTLNSWPYTSGEIQLEAAFAQNCDTETTVTACDTSNPTKPICTLTVGLMGEVTYNNGCCTGYSLPDATTTE